MLPAVDSILGHHKKCTVPFFLTVPQSVIHPQVFLITSTFKTVAVVAVGIKLLIGRIMRNVCKL